METIAWCIVSLSVGFMLGSYIQSRMDIKTVKRVLKEEYDNFLEKEQNILEGSQND